MIKIINDNILTTNAQIIVQIVNTNGDLNNNIPSKINETYRHITKEYIKYINYCRKKREETLGKTQYIPLDVWALGLVDTTKNKYIEVYDGDYKYIACAFVQTREGGKYNTDENALKKCLNDIHYKAKLINANVAIMYSNVLYDIVKEIFRDTKTNVYLYKEK